MAEPTARDLELLRQAIDLGDKCPPGHTFSVGAVIADDGGVLAGGYSREFDAVGHAEEAALSKVDPGDDRLAGATMYSSLEPCSTRASRPVSCAQLIIDAGIRRVVFAWREPDLKVVGEGAEVLAAAGCTVIEVPSLAPLVQATNADLLG